MPAVRLSAFTVDVLHARFRQHYGRNCPAPVAADGSTVIEFDEDEIEKMARDWPHLSVDEAVRRILFRRRSA